MTSILTVTSPNTDRSLLTAAELRTAAGASDNSQDASLALLGGYVSSSIAKACNVAVDGVTPPTLRLETATDTFRLVGSQRELILSRRPVVSITSVTENGTLLTAADYEVDADAGLLYRLSSSVRIYWPGVTIVIVYPAGYATVPDDLKYAAIKFVQAELQQGGRDPLLKRRKIEGVSEYEWWVDPTKDSIIPAEVMDILLRGGYINTWIS